MALSMHMRGQVFDLLRLRAVYASLHTSNPGEDGRSEVRGGGYERQLILWAEEPDQLVNEGGLDFTYMPPVTVNATGIWDAPVGGNFLWGGDTVPRTTNAGDTYQIPDASLIADIV